MDTQLLVRDSQDIFKTLQKFLIDFYNNDIIQSMLTIFLVLYGGKAVRTLPDYIVELFKVPIFRVLSIGLTSIVIGAAGPTTGIMAAVSFILTLTLIKRLPIIGNSNVNNVKSAPVVNNRNNSVKNTVLNSVKNSVNSLNSVPEGLTNSSVNSVSNVNWAK